MPVSRFLKASVMHGQPRLAAWTYHCDEQDADYEVQLRYEVHPAERSLGLERAVEVLGVHEVVCGYVAIEGLAVKLEPGDWERRMLARIELRLIRSDALRDQAETACRRDLDATLEKWFA